MDEWCTDVAAKGPKHVIETIEQQEKHAFLHEAIKELPEILKPAFVVTVLDGFTYQEASEILEVPIGTVASRVYEARKILQTIMLKRFPEE